MRRTSVGYIGLRLVNSMLGVGWGFALTAVMIRVVGIDHYAHYVLIGALGLYLASIDLGISNLVYARLRERFLSHDEQSLAAPVRGAISIYIGVALASVALYAAFALAGSWRTGDVWLAPALFFSATIANLPWTAMRAVSNALERQLFFETVDLLRRMAQLVVIFGLLGGFSLAAAFLLLNLIWAVGLVAVRRPLAHGGFMPRRIGRGTTEDLRAFGRLFGPDARHSSLFFLSEAFSYNFPYLALPLLFGANASVVLFDLFSKFLRAAILGNQIASIGLLPEISRAFFAGDTRGLARHLLWVLGLSLAAMTLLAALLLGFREEILAVLLRGQAWQATPSLWTAVLVVILANAVQNTAGSFIVNVGLVRPAGRLALTIALLFLLATLIDAAIGVNFDRFILGYAVLYAIGALAWGGFAAWIVWRDMPVRTVAALGAPP